MDTGEIPDSDPAIPELDADDPHWFHLGGLSSLKLHEDRENAAKARDGSTQDASERSENNHKNTRIEPNIAKSVQSHDGPSEGSLISVPETDNAPRRRRFNFERWVAEDRKTHEYVYHKRFKNFHGALSDSEDEDYADLQDLNIANDANEQYADSNVSEEEDSMDGDGSEEKDENGDKYAFNGQGIKRRRKLIDSDSSSSSESENGAEDNDDPVEIFERRLKTSIPAVMRTAVGNSLGNESSLDQSQDFFSTGSYEQQSHNTLSDSAGDNNWTRHEAQEDYRGLDYMLAPPNRDTRSKKRQPTIAELTHEVGGNSRISRLAARTAKSSFKRGKSTSNLQSAMRSPSNTSTKTRSYPQIVGPHGKLFVNQSRETMRTMKNWSHGKIQGTNPSREPHVLPIVPTPQLKSSKVKVGQPAPKISTASSLAAHSSGKQKRKTKRRRFASSNNTHLRTTIIERQLSRPMDVDVPIRMNPIESSAKPNYASMEMDTKLKTGNSVSERDEMRRYADMGRPLYSRLRIPSHSPSRHVTIREFGNSTFIGSNLLDLLDSPTIWDGVSISQDFTLFKTSLRVANEATIAGDAILVQDICSSSTIDLPLFNEVYDYFIQGAAFLCDESEIIEQKFVQFVLYEWLRLSRKLLKLSIRRRWNTHFSSKTGYFPILITEVVALATLIVSKRVSLLSAKNVKEEKVKLLLGWILYYHQTAISFQIDNVSNRTDRERVGVELIYVAAKISGFDTLLHVFAKNLHSNANWHLLENITAVDGRWHNWELARKLLSVDIDHSQGVRVAMKYIQRLLSVWNWPGSPEIIGDLFVYYTKQQNYADIRGESIWLPSFLLTSNFDGGNKPDQDFSMFLELLGTTFRKCSSDQKACLRLAGRVTPLSAMSFPEEKEVSLADLSSASHQYGILIVLLRMLDSQNRPSVSQFRDLVVLKNAHWAIKIKAVSAWNIVSRILKEDEHLHECMRWMQDDIFFGEYFPENLINVALKACIEMVPRAMKAVPFSRLVHLGVRSHSTEIRKQAWQLLAKCLNSKHDAINEAVSYSDIPYHDHYDEQDFDALIMLFGSQSLDLVAKWHSDKTISANDARRAFARIFASKNISLTLGLQNAGLLLVESLVSPQLSQDDKDLILSMTHGLGSSLETNRRGAVRQIMRKGLLTKDHWIHALELVELNLSTMSSGSKIGYIPLAGEVRRLAFDEFPHLKEQYPLNEVTELHVLETMQQNIMNFARRNDWACYYYFAYRLRQCCDFSESFEKSINGKDLQFIAELMDSISLNDECEAQKLSDVVFNHLFATIFDMATSTYHRTLKSKVSFVLPILVKAAVANIGRGTKLRYDCFRFLDHVSTYIASRVSLDPAFMKHPASVCLLSAYFNLMILWMNQSVASGQCRIPLAVKVLQIARRIKYETSTSNGNATNTRTPPLPLGYLEEDCAMADVAEEDIISVFATDQFDDERILDSQDDHASFEIRELIQNIKVYLAVCASKLHQL